MKKLSIFEAEVGETLKEYFNATAYSYEEAVSFYNELAELAKKYVEDTDKEISKGSTIGDSSLIIKSTVEKGNTVHKDHFKFSAPLTSWKGKEIVITSYQSNRPFEGNVMKFELANKKVTNNYLKEKYKPHTVTFDEVKAEMEKTIQHSKQ